MLAIIFQVLYSLVCFAHVGLQHNDMHLGNIWIEDLGRPVVLYYARRGDKYVELKTRWFVKIYDWDRGSSVHPAVPSNLELSYAYCRRIGTCEAWNPKYDLFKFLSILMSYAPAIGPHFAGIIRLNWIENVMDMSWYDQLKVKLEEKDQWHNGLPFRTVPTDAQLRPPRQVLIAFLQATWDDAPFREVSGDGSNLPAEIFFHTPPEQKRVLEMWHPVSTATHPSLQIQLPTYKIGSGGLGATVKPDPEEIVELWLNELDQDGHDPDIPMGKLMTQLRTKKPGLSSSPDEPWYIQACAYLICYQFYRLERPQQNAILVSTEMRAVVDDIFNLFGNQLPIEIPRYVMEPA